MFSSSSNSTRGSCNPTRCSFTDHISSTFAPYMTSTFRPSSLNSHICSTCFQALATVQTLVAQQASHRQQMNDFCTRMVHVQQAVRDEVLPPPESVSWLTAADGSSSGNKIRKVLKLKVMPSAELTLATGAALDVLLDLDGSDDLEFYLKL